MLRFSSFLKSIGTLTDRIVCLVCAVVLAQVPVYIAQYTDVLSGAHMEAKKVYDEVVEVANNYQLSVEQFLEEMGSNPDEKVRDMSGIQQNTVDRYLRYDKALTALTKGSLWLKPFALIRHFDPSVHEAMFFEPNVPLTFEGAIYAFLGLLIALLLIGLVKRIGKSIRRSRDKSKAMYEIGGGRTS
jgi:hypothetical protein